MAMTEEERHPDDEPRAIPHNPDAEQAVIGAALLRYIDPPLLTDDLFWRPAYREAARAIRATHEAGQVIDPITVAEHAPNLTAGQLLDAEGRWGTPAWADHLAICRRYARARAVIALGHRVLEVGYGHSVDLDDQVGDLAASLRRLADELEGPAEGDLRGPRAA